MIYGKDQKEQLNVGLANIPSGLVLLVDKPLQWTSFDVVKKLRWLLKRKAGLKKLKVGHAGTLDPLATGLLIVCAGKETKSINQYQGLHKRYTAELKLGATTPSYDAETEEANHQPIDHLTTDSIVTEIQKFKGLIWQKPPMYSAIKKDGKKLYEHARAGETIEVKSRQVQILDLEITKMNLPYIQIDLVCSKGTYVRSLAFDIGEALGVGAYLTSLRRTSIGHYEVEQAFSIEEWVQLIEQEIKEE